MRSSFGSYIDSLIEYAEPAPLGPGKPYDHETVKLGELSVDDLFQDHEVKDREMAQLCLAGLLLRYNHIEAAHGISQGAENPTAALWHAIMHRREPDPGNAKYWLKNVGDHPIYPSLLQSAKSSSHHGPFHDWDTWQPGIFVDICDDNRDSGSDYERACIEIQEAEWRELFAYCFQQAVGK
ncbi:MAG: hypothetical protein Q7P63_10620 [Verrucomicrobiota bacterium JB022]|nr:hypothetical protein [Verrucomicrobiota bacterium JB022]